MPTNTLTTTQYTEENYSELYNNLPTGLKDLVLSGRLAILVSGVGVKNGLNADQVSELEPAVEDVCLGLITSKELPQNIATQVGIDISLARKIAGDTLTEILEPFTQDINFARQFKLEMDEKISGVKNKASVSGLPSAESLRAQILNENKDKIGSDQKVANFFNKKPQTEDSETSTYYGEEEAEEVEMQNDLGASNFIVKEKEVFEETPISKSKISGGLSFNDLISKSSNSGSTSTSTNIVTDNNNTTNTNATMIRFEQELATLTQAINSLVRSTPTGKDFNLKSFEEISSQINKIEKEVGEIKLHQTEIENKIKHLETQSLINNSATVKDSQPLHSNIEQQARNPAKVESKPFVFTSTVSKDAMEAIATSPSPKKVFSFEELTGKTSGNSNSNFVWNKGGADFSKSVTDVENQKIAEDKKEEEEVKADKEEKKKMLSSVLLKDLQNLKTNSDENISANIGNNSVQTDINAVLENASKSASTNLKSELLPQNKEDRMKILQEKIRNLNQGKI